jgi:hypothetical protein
MPELIDSETKKHVAEWMSTHYPDDQGKKDAEAGIPRTDSSEITPFEKQLVESFEKQISLVRHGFSRNEGTLYSSFKSITAELATKKQEYEKIRKKVGDREPEVTIRSTVLGIILVLSFACLAVLNIYLLDAIFYEEVIKVPLGVIIAIFNVALAYFIGRLVRQHGMKVKLGIGNK